MSKKTWPTGNPLQVILRDDDVSALTSVDELTQLYGPAWDRDVPVCLFVVPLASPQIRQALGQAEEAHLIPLIEQFDLLDFLNRAILSGQVEIGLHGLRHSPGEFDTPNKAVVMGLLDEAKGLVERALPRAKVRSFVPPRECMSAVARDVVLQQGFHICAASTALWPPSRLGWWLHRLRQRLGWPGFHGPISRGDRWLFPCDEYLFTPARPPEQCLRRAQRMAAFCQRFGRPLICVNHHWHFGREGNPGMLDVWHTFLEGLLARDDVHFLTFDTYRRHPASLVSEEQ